MEKSEKRKAMIQIFEKHGMMGSLLRDCIDECIALDHTKTVTDGMIDSHVNKIECPNPNWNPFVYDEGYKSGARDMRDNKIGKNN